MALGTITKVESVAAQGPIFIDRVTIVGDGSYPTGGSALFEAALQAKIGYGRQIVDLRCKTGARILEYNHATDKLQAYTTADGAEVANTTDLSGTTFEVIVTSK